MKSEYIDPELLAFLQREFSARWADAVIALKDKNHPQHLHAATCWMGFKEGYFLAMVQPGDKEK